MSNIDELIQEFCPEGVEFKRIKDAYSRIKGTPITAGKMKEISNSDGDIRVFAGGRTVINAYEGDIPNANITRVPAVLVQSRGVIDAVYYDKPFTFKNEMWAYTAKSSVSVKYLYYVLKHNIKYFRDAASGMGSLPQISLKVTEDFKIPIPPLEVQQEIVNILDKFTQLEAELSTELEARRTQYDYYRNQLLTFDDATSVRSLTLGDLGKIVTGRTPKSSESSYWGNAMQFVTPSDIKTGSKYISAANRQLSDKGASAMKANVIPANSILVTCIGSDMGKTVVNVSECVTNQQINSIILDDGVSADYVYHLLASKVNYLKALGAANGSTMPIINKSSFSKIEIELPPLETQIEIAKLLDKFDLLVNDIQEGLPAEITARRQQYEYYRTKLLTFQESQA